MLNEGKVLQVIGPVVDVEFDEALLPRIYQALQILSDGFEVPIPINITVEVQQHLGEGRCRCVAMEPTEGLIRGMKVIDTGNPNGARWADDIGASIKRHRSASGSTWSSSFADTVPHSSPCSIFSGSNI